MSGMAEAEPLSLRRNGQEVGTEQLSQLKVRPIPARAWQDDCALKAVPKIQPVDPWQCAFLWAEQEEGYEVAKKPRHWENAAPKNLIQLIFS